MRLHVERVRALAAAELQQRARRPLAGEQLREEGVSVANAQLRYIHPLPNDLESILSNYKHVLIPEVNMGQLATLIRATYAIDAQTFNKVKGKPIHIHYIDGHWLDVNSLDDIDRASSFTK